MLATCHYCGERQPARRLRPLELSAAGQVRVCRDAEACRTRARLGLRVPTRAHRSPAARQRRRFMVGQALGGRSLLLFWSSASQYFLTSRSKGATTTFGSSLDAALVSARSRRTSNRPLQVKPVANLDARAARRDDPYMRRLVATLLIGMGLVGAVYLSSLKLGAVVYLPSGVHCRYLAPHACGGLLPSPVPPIRSSPAWQLPVSLLIGVLGIAGGLLVMRQPAAVSDPAV